MQFKRPLSKKPTFDVGSASADSLDRRGYELFVRLRDVSLEFSQDGGNVGLRRQIGQDLQFEEANVKRIRVGSNEKGFEIRLEHILPPQRHRHDVTQHDVLTCVGMK